MPTSVLEQIPMVVRAVEAYGPNRILDVGIGWGKYAFLLREYLGGGPPAEEMNPKTRKLHIDGVEVFDSYVTDLQRLVYDRIIMGDIVDLAPSLGEYDVILMIDVIEHIPRESANSTIDRLLERTRQGIILTTPNCSFPQEEVYGNPWERHIDQWTKQDFVRWPFVQTLASGDKLLICISKTSQMNWWMTEQRKRKSVLWPLRWGRRQLRTWWCEHKQTTVQP